MPRQGLSMNEESNTKVEPENVTIEDEGKASVVKASISYKIILLIVTLLSVAAVAASYMLWMQIEKNSNNLSGQINSHLEKNLQAAAETQRRQIEKTNLVVEQNRQSNLHLLQLLQSMQKELEERSRGDVKLIQAESILRLAKSQYEILHDRETTIAALKLAANLLNDFSDQKIIVIRNLILTEAKSVEDLVVQDITAELINLDLLIQTAADLPLKTAVPEKEKESEGVGSAETKKTLGDKLKGMLKALQPLVTVRRNKGANIAMLSVEEEKLVRIILKSRYEQIRQAMLRKDTAMLKTGINITQTWLKQYFNTDNDAVKKALIKIADWNEIALDVKYPPVGYALQQLSKFRTQGEVTKTP